MTGSQGGPSAETLFAEWLVQREDGVALLRQGRFLDAEFALLESAEWFLANDAPSESEWIGGADPTTEAVRAVVELYETRHAAEPGQGFDAQAATWRAKLGAVDASSDE